MMLPNPDPSSRPEALYRDIAAFVNEADERVAAREEVDLDGLDLAIRALCDGILRLPVTEAKLYNEKLTELMAAIDTLQKKMTAQQEEIAASLKALGSQKKAARAYSNAPKGKVDT